MANFNIHFPESDDLSMLMQRDNEDSNVNDIPIDDMEELMNSSKDSAVCTIASFDGNKSGSDSKIINVAERYKPMVEDISYDNKYLFAFLLSKN